MQAVSGLSQEPNPNYYVHQPCTTGITDEIIYHKTDAPQQKPVEVVTRSVVEETVFLPDWKAPPLITHREGCPAAPEPKPFSHKTAVAPTDSLPKGSFNLIRALGLNADCPCWAWILIVLGFILLIALVIMCLGFILARHSNS